MKTILSIIISSALVVSGHSQTRNVLVGTNNAVVQPTNFWSADASNARIGLGLGSAATNPASAFQPSSSVLTNLALGNGGSLTNLNSSNISGTVALASNITGIAPLATNVTGVVALANGGTSGTNAASARTGLGATTVGANLFTLINPDDIRFIRINANNTVSAISATDMRTALSAGTVTSVGMTVPNIFSLSSPTITSSGTFGLTLTNQSSRHAFLAPNGGGTPAFRALESDDLPSLAISKVTGLQTALDGKLETSGTAALATNVTGVVAVANGGTGGTNAESGRTGLGATTVGSAVFTLANPSAIRFLRYNADNTVSALSDSDFRTAIGLGSVSTNPATAFQPASSNLTNLAVNNGSGLTNIPLSGVVGALATNGNGFALTNLNASNITGLIPASNISSVTISNLFGTLAIASGGTGATNAGGARTNLGLGATNNVTFNKLQLGGGAGTNAALFIFDEETILGDGVLYLEAGEIIFKTPIQFNNTTNAATTRTNLGLGWSALTNSNASGFQTALFGTNTNPVFVNTNGEVVSPTNFWQVSPANTRVQISQPVINATNNATNARNLFLYSLAISTTGVTNTVQLPTNGGTLLGDVATVIHEGPTSSITAVRQTGAGSNLITLNQFQEAVKFIYESGGWRLADNISYVEPIYFSGTNAAANAAASRTNLGLGTTNTVNFARLELTDTTTNANLLIADQGEIEGDGDLFIGAGALIFKSPIEFSNITNAATTRTNLGIPLAALTNTSVTNFQKAIFYTNTAPSNVGGNLGTIAAWIEIVASNGVTYKIPAYTNVP